MDFNLEDKRTAQAQRKAGGLSPEMQTWRENASTKPAPGVKPAAAPLPGMRGGAPQTASEPLSGLNSKLGMVGKVAKSASAVASPLAGGWRAGSDLNDVWRDDKLDLIEKTGLSAEALGNAAGGVIQGAAHWLPSTIFGAATGSYASFPQNFRPVTNTLNTFGLRTGLSDYLAQHGDGAGRQPPVAQPAQPAQTSTGPVNPPLPTYETMPLPANTQSANQSQEDRGFGVRAYDAGSAQAKALGQQLDDRRFIPRDGEGIVRNNRTGRVISLSAPSPEAKSAQGTGQAPISLDDLLQERARRALSGNVAGARALSGSIEAMQARAALGLMEQRLRDEWAAREAASLAKNSQVVSAKEAAKDVDELLGSVDLGSKEKNDYFKDFARYNFPEALQLPPAELRKQLPIIKGKAELGLRAGNKEVGGRASLYDISGGKARPVKFDDIDWSAWARGAFDNEYHATQGRNAIKPGDYLGMALKEHFPTLGDGRVYEDPRGGKYRMGELTGGAGNLGARDVEEMLLAKQKKGN